MRILLIRATALVIRRVRRGFDGAPRVAITLSGLAAGICATFAAAQEEGIDSSDELGPFADVFHWLVVPISIVLGLTIARVLLGYVNAFKARAHLRFDWLPLAFAGAILGEALQYWWAMLELAELKSWSLPAFTLLFVMVMVLFIAAALIIPAETDVDMRAAFERDGRWALVALASFHVLAIVANGWLWGVSIFTSVQGLLMVLAALSLIGGLTRRRSWQIAVVVAYLCLSVADTFIASVPVY